MINFFFIYFKIYFFFYHEIYFLKAARYLGYIFLNETPIFKIGKKRLMSTSTNGMYILLMKVVSLLSNVAQYSYPLL